MNSPIRILHLEDDKNDAELVHATLSSEGVVCDIALVDTRDVFISSIEKFSFDLILADYSLPSFDGFSALEIAKRKCPDIPFIFVSGALGEEYAVETLKRGATDYVLKNRLSKLATSINRALREADEKAKRRRLEEQLIHVQKMEAVGQLAGGIAHDFSNVLMVVKGFARILEDEMGADDPLKVNVERIISAADKGANLVQDLLTFSSRRKMEPVTVDLNQIVKIAEGFLLKALRKDVELRIKLAQEALTVMADATQIEHVLINLATNARDAMPEGGILTIETCRAELDEEFVRPYGYGKPGAYALINVTDTGTGMDEEKKERLFEPFFTTKEIGKGTGLGLSIVYGIIKQHNGCVNVFSEAGNGTTFKVYLPLTGSVG